MTDFLAVTLYLLAGLAFAVIPMIISWLVVKKSHGAMREATYESGMETIGSAWIQFTVAYYIYALIFLAFDVDVLYLFPVALAYGKYAFARPDRSYGFRRDFVAGDRLCLAKRSF